MIKPLAALEVLESAPRTSAPRGKGFRTHLAAAASNADTAQALAAALGHKGIDAALGAAGHRTGDALDAAHRRIELGTPSHRRAATHDAHGPHGGPVQPPSNAIGATTDDQPATPSTDPAPAQVAAAAARTDSPVAALLAAAVGRAIGSLRTAPATTPPPAIAEPASAPIAGLTPLEQAVHDLIAIAHAEPQHDEPRPHDDDHEPTTPVLAAPTTTVAAPDDAPAPAPAHPAAPIAAPEPPANPSHVHLVLDDGPERVVVTVAVRGSDVHVALRGGDDATAASLARNAASLDHAMRARGLQLADFTHDRESPRGRPHDPDPERRHQRRDQAERFTLEKDTP